MAFCDGVCKVANYVKMITNLHYDTNIKKIVIHVDSECVIYRLRRVKALRKMKTITSLETKRLEDVITKINELGSMGITVEVRHINGDKNPADGPSRPHGNDAPSPMTRTEVQHAVATASIATLDVVFDPRLTDEKDDLQAVDGNPPICKVNVIDIEHFFEDEEIKHLQDADGRLSTIKATLRNVPLNERPNGMRMYCLDENNVLYFTEARKYKNVYLHYMKEKAMLELPSYLLSINNGIPPPRCDKYYDACYSPVPYVNVQGKEPVLVEQEELFDLLDYTLVLAVAMY
ncbi:hypothetical protein Pmar_PMAR017753 [Perkinsus marinus ATCC 50983]|uniref:Uncharacterized protein n=1 Tax=Perkinsus marinus (strain ATCC 50983 / TXsc) TaxID=423536 RepID=C5L3W6_PERM5|nr:hypothetical protein Pmar_PMAR017753 [Perkinsus marinus ATCC 50983]EER08695.1 hypothetical protein Pmar_PMAR017753 [Perkinsus marinus ATCC 50983]|eukprot:XP_002776879.1 hypothetical protein Pmar_PMAR017753 [Perkinsus marinus ATCC 50983]